MYKALRVLWLLTVLLSVPPNLPDLSLRSFSLISGAFETSLLSGLRTHTMENGRLGSARRSGRLFKLGGQGGQEVREEEGECPEDLRGKTGCQESPVERLPRQAFSRRISWQRNCPKCFGKEHTSSTLCIIILGTLRTVRYRLHEVRKVREVREVIR